MTIDLSTPCFAYGAPALYAKFRALPCGQLPLALDPPTPERIRIECGIVDDWAQQLFRYCRRRPPVAMRFHAMLLDARWLDPTDRYLRIGLYPTLEACERVKHWTLFAERMPQPPP